MARYLAWVTLLNLVWEVLQLPLYTLWSDAAAPKIAFAVLHCTAGDLLIATFSLLLALAIPGTRGWPLHRFRPVAIGTILLGLSYTVYSEWHNTTVSHAWAYSAAMPTILGIGLAPVAQWLLVPVLAFWRLQHRLLPDATLP